MFQDYALSSYDLTCVALSTMSPGPQFGIMFRRPPMPRTAMMYRFLAPLLSAQFMSVATQQPRVIFSLPPARPTRPRFMAPAWGRCEGVLEPNKMATGRVLSAMLVLAAYAHPLI